MKKKTILQLLIVATCLGVAGVGLYHALSQVSESDKTALIALDKTLGWKFPITKFPLTGLGERLLTYSDIRAPGGVPHGLPVRLKIPVIAVDSAIEDALITPDGRMDVPVGSKNVAWFALGPKPGNAGSAVIGGHFGMSNGVPFVFYNLDKLKVGDKIHIVDDQNNTITFVVRSVALFDRAADATSVFASKDGLAHLNLITCEGVWNKINGGYPERRVVFTDKE
jgi:LPXTG-site transpeptidase (sortase) family protein